MLMNLKCASSTAGPIPHTVSEIIRLLFVLDIRLILSSRPGSIKKGNRKSEILLRDAEVGLSPIFQSFVSLVWRCIQHVATLASIFKGSKYKYPKQTLDDSWEKVLLNQCTQLLSSPRSWILMRCACSP